MDYEKAYKEALERAKVFINSSKSENWSKKTARAIFPQLAENEDERIRKEIIKHFSRILSGEDVEFPPQDDLESWIALLEKQGEKDEEILILKDQIESLHAAIKAVKETYKIKLERQGEQKPEYPLANEKMDVERWKEACKAACIDRNYRSHYGLTETRDDYFVDGVQWADEHPKRKPEWSEEDETGWTNTMIMIKECAANHYNKDSIKLVIDFLKSIKNRVLPQPKQEWSEEDEKGLADALWCCGRAVDTARDENEMGNCSYAENWLKSLRPQKQWKPTEEQMTALNLLLLKGKITEIWQAPCLQSLYKDLEHYSYER